MEEQDQTKYESSESCSQQGPSQRRNEKPPTCYYCGKVSHIEPRVRNNIGDMKHSLFRKDKYHPYRQHYFKRPRFSKTSFRWNLFWDSKFWKNPH
ncbi:hypothetical protein CEXT_727871 [Caerostris extrusa]|uniref:Uncharacterized protein n=1 Tax=Caerostris extrusa TaxID=172846 RepID=A0AAV4N0N0_CAEEX|nr:hypothetical protein CEXT_727871 [Caerostris extrusa]